MTAKIGSLFSKLRRLAPATWGSLILGGLGIVSFLLTHLGRVAGLSSEHDVAIVTTCVLGGIVFALWLALGSTQARSSLEARRGEAAPSLRDAIRLASEVAFLLQRSPTTDADTIRRELGFALNELARGLSISTARHCRVCITDYTFVGTGGNSDPAEEVRNIKVQAVCRSDPTASAVRSDPDWIEYNSDFLDIYLGKTPYFFSNDLYELTRAGKYFNSHIPRDAKKSDYPYLAAITYPICREINGERTLIGWVCADAARSHAFHKADVDFIAAFAEIVFNPMFMLKERTTQPESASALRGTDGTS